MDVVISNMAWLPKDRLGEVEVFLLKKRLTLIPKLADFGPATGEDKPPKILTMWRETATHLGVPRGYFFKHMDPVKHHLIHDLSVGRALTPNSKSIVLRPDDQQPILDKFLLHYKRPSFAGGIVEAWTGFGKTIFGIKLAEMLGFSTIILVHKNPLKDQWIERIKDFYPTAKVGVVQGPQCDFVGKDFVIAMAQSIMKNAGDKYPDALWKAFGLVITDEIHRFGAEAFSTVAMRFTARNMLGLSATPYRPDGCADAFKWVIGEVLAKPKATNQQKPIVYVRKTGFVAVRRETRDPQTGKVTVFDMNDFQKPTLLGFITRSKYRNNLIAADLVFALKSGRNPLVMSERLDILYSVAEAVAKVSKAEIGREVTHGFYIGGKKKDELAAAARCDVVYTTMQLAKEGIDIVRLDTIFITSPFSDPTQAVGRIGRTKTVVGADGTARVEASAKRPMIVDYVDNDLKIFRSLYFSRLKFYTRQGFEIIGANVG